MDSTPVTPEVDSLQRTGRLERLLLVLIVVWLAGVAYLWMINRAPLAAVALAAPIGLLLITSPRWSLYQFIFCSWLLLVVMESVPLLLIDVSALIVIGAASLDLLLSDRLPRRLPPLTLFYAFIVAALVVAGVFSYVPERSLRPIARVIFLAVTFLSVFRLSRHCDLGQLLRLFFWIGVAHAIIALIPFIAAGGTIRSFGLGMRILDELAMLALPIGVSFFVMSTTRMRLSYLVGCVLLLGALLATQSRAPIGVGVMISGMVLLVAWHRSRRDRSRSTVEGGYWPAVRRRVAIVLTFVAVGAGSLVAAKPSLFLAVFERFHSLVTFEATGTLLLRLQLWERALTAFVDHPLVGVGPGMFRAIGDVYQTLHLSPVSPYLQGLSAHNLTLHYMAESGLIGVTALLALFVAQVRLGRQCWVAADNRLERPVALALYALSVLFLVTTLVEGAWMFGGQAGLLASLLLALIARGAVRARERG